MKPIGIVTDSHSGIAPEDAQQMGIYVLPMPFYVDEECFYEGVTISRASFFEQLEEGKKVSTSQPSPDEVMKLWNEVLKEYESNLKKGGRISPATAAIGTLLNIKPVLQLDVGVLESFCKCRGMKKARKDMLAAIKKDMETKYGEYYNKGEVYLLAASSAEEAVTKEWVEEIRAYFPGMDVLCDDLSLGICCHTGKGALGVGCSCKPKR